MGSPKALLRIASESFVECIARKAKSAGIENEIVVTGPDHDQISQHVPPNLTCIRNENFSQGQISSLQTGIRALSQEVSAAVVWPVDQPLVRTETVIHLVDVFRRESRPLTIPTHGGRKGHPVIYSKEAMQSALGLSYSQTGKDLQVLFAEVVTFVEVDDPGVVLDIDTPEDYEQHIH